ncbi:unnamed protein product [Macrosiphum euphorbiae]|uniref:Uncharacterized protein n=1 Tax=Macrosiphum euphorbiae TaxID=13131 RepID=A0AAV0X1K1_9HEMI|nr:unnamed protein product [Macrosiphum euphorbiae]
MARAGIIYRGSGGCGHRRPLVGDALCAERRWHQQQHPAAVVIGPIVGRRGRGQRRTREPRHCTPHIFCVRSLVVHPTDAAAPAVSEPPSSPPPPPFATLNTVTTATVASAARWPPGTRVDDSSAN